MFLQLDGSKNTRDLGGIATTFGKIKPNRLVRSSHLNKITQQDVQKLLRHNLQRVIDLRTEAEQQNVPDVQIDGVDYVTIPIMGKTTFGITYEKSSGEEIGLMLQAGIKRMQRRGEIPTQHMEILYQNFVGDPISMQGYGNFLKLLANNPVDGATLWHCSAGKDRVGTCTALLLHCLGASREQIMQDYLLTNQQNKPFVDMVLGKIQGTLKQEYINLILSMLTVRAEYIDAFWQKIETHYGDVDNFVSACSVSATDIANLRKNYLE